MGNRAGRQVVDWNTWHVWVYYICPGGTYWSALCIVMTLALKLIENITVPLCVNVVVRIVETYYSLTSSVNQYFSFSGAVLPTFTSSSCQFFFMSKPAHSLVFTRMIYLFLTSVVDFCIYICSRVNLLYFCDLLLYCLPLKLQIWFSCCSAWIGVCREGRF